MDDLTRAGVSGSAENMTPERIAQLRADPNTQVYDIVTDPIERVLPMSEVRENINEARRLFHHHRRAHPTWDDERIREAILATSDEMRSFGTHSHRRIFERVTNRETTQAIFTLLERGIATQMLVESGEITADLARASMSRDVLSYEEKRQGGDRAQSR